MNKECLACIAPTPALNTKPIDCVKCRHQRNLEAIGVESSDADKYGPVSGW
jgi:hypothetical protein